VSWPSIVNASPQPPTQSPPKGRCSGLEKNCVRRIMSRMLPAKFLTGAREQRTAGYRDPGDRYECDLLSQYRSSSAPVLPVSHTHMRGECIRVSSYPRILVFTGERVRQIRDRGAGDDGSIAIENRPATTGEIHRVGFAEVSLAKHYMIG
jgi:hypothetical protein